MALIQHAQPAPRAMARASEGCTGKAVEFPSRDVAERVAGQGISRQQDYVEQQNQGTYTDSDPSLKKESTECVAPKKNQEDEWRLWHGRV